MKQLLSAICVMVCCSACAQQNALDKFYDQYKSSDALTGSISISPGFWLSTSFSSSADEKWKDKVTNLRLLILDGKKTPGAAVDASDLARKLRDGHFDDLVNVRKGHQLFQVLGRESDGIYSQLVLLMRGDDDGVVFAEIDGKFTSHDVETIQGSLH